MKTLVPGLVREKHLKGSRYFLGSKLRWEPQYSVNDDYISDKHFAFSMAQPSWAVFQFHDTSSPQRNNQILAPAEKQRRIGKPTRTLSLGDLLFLPLCHAFPAFPQYLSITVLTTISSTGYSICTFTLNHSWGRASGLFWSWDLLVPSDASNAILNIIFPNQSSR